MFDRFVVVLKDNAVLFFCEILKQTLLFWSTFVNLLYCTLCLFVCLLSDDWSSASPVLPHCLSKYANKLFYIVCITKLTLIHTPVHLLLLHHESIIYNTIQFMVYSAQNTNKINLQLSHCFDSREQHVPFLQTKTQMQSVHLYQRRDGKSAAFLTGLS